MVHIIGANGYIGTKLCNYLKDKSVVFDCFSDKAEEGIKDLNLTKFDESELRFNKGDIVVLLAAISSPDICQNNYDFAYSVNVIGTSRMIDYCLKAGTKVIFFSSDVVNGDTGDKVFDEFSEVNPFGNYGKMKYEIEKKYKESPLFKAIRLSYVLSDEDKFSSYLHNCVMKNETAKVFDGLYRNVIKLETVLESVYCLIKNFDFNDYYLVNISGNQNLSRKDLAIAFQRNVDNSLSFDIISIPKEMLNGRPNIIHTKSLFLEKLLGHKLENIL